MKAVGFPISTKKIERRRALAPDDILSNPPPTHLYIEEGYGNVLGYDDNDYSKLGFYIVPQNKVLLQDIICDSKIGDANYLNEPKQDQVIFGWIHAVQNRQITDILVTTKFLLMLGKIFLKRADMYFTETTKLMAKLPFCMLFYYMGFSRMKQV